MYYAQKKYRKQIICRIDVSHFILVVELVPGASNVTGKLNLLSIRNVVQIQGIIYDLEEGFHGFHVHMTGDLGNNCKAAGGHFNPDMVRSWKEK